MQRKEELRGSSSSCLLWSISPLNIERHSPTLSLFPSPLRASSSIPLFSSVDHGKLISICFAVISHNSSIAAAAPAYWARLPQCQLSLLLPASRHRLTALALHTLHGLAGFSVSCIQALSSAATKVLCPHPPPECVVICFALSCLCSVCYAAVTRCSSYWPICTFQLTCCQRSESEIDQDWQVSHCSCLILLTTNSSSKTFWSHNHGK